jgi:prepilin-type N-terminal cleavage/methylation domain-containing protein
MNRVRRGVTLVEMMVVVAITAMIAIAIAQSMVQGSKAFDKETNRSHLDILAHTVLERMTSELKNGIQSSLSIGANPASWIAFQTNVGYGVSPGGPIRFDLVMKGGETLNGADDNGDGRVDEGNIVITDPSKNPPTRIIASDVAQVGGQGGLVFSQSASGNRITITVNLHKVVAGTDLTVSRSSSVSLQN